MPMQSHKSEKAPGCQPTQGPNHLQQSSVVSCYDACPVRAGDGHPGVLTHILVTSTQRHTRTRTQAHARTRARTQAHKQPGRSHAHTHAHTTQPGPPGPL